MAMNDTNESFGRLIFTSFIVMGMIVAVGGAIWLFRTAAFMRNAARAPGHVIAMDRRAGAEGYHAVFTFTDSSGGVHTQRSSFYSSKFAFEPGEQVIVLYNPKTPKHSEIDSFKTLWFGPVFVTGFGMMFVVFARFLHFVWTRAMRLHTNDVA